MEYLTLRNRLRSIREEIIVLRTAPYSDLQEKILTLGKINVLLLEQNELLIKRQELIGQNTEVAKFLSLKTLFTKPHSNDIPHQGIPNEDTWSTKRPYYSKSKTA